MPERWLRFCRRLVPAVVRQTTFDPAAADLELEWASRGAPTGQAARFRLRLALVAVALQCRRLAAHAGVSHPHRPGADLMAILTDLRHAARRLRGQPVLTLVAVLTLALGTGANLAVFSTANAMLLEPIRAPAPDRLVRVYPLSADGGFDKISYPDYQDARDGAPGLDLAAHAEALVEIGRAGEGGGVRVAELVSGNYFRVLGLAPEAGRLFDVREDEGELAHPVVVLSETFWRASLGAAPDAVGRSLTINGAAFDVIGIAPKGFRGTFNAHPVDLWVPLTMQQVARPRGLTLDQRGWGWMSMIGRLEPRTTLVEAQRQLTLVAADHDRRFPQRGAGFAFTVTPALAATDGDRQLLGPMLAAVFAFTALLLAVTCANLGGLLQARLGARRRELAIRQSLGANRRRLVWDGTAEALLIAGAGATAGLLVAALMTSLLSSLDLPESLVGNLTLVAPVGWRVVAYAAGLGLFAALLFGALPAWRASRLDASGFLKGDGTTIGGGRRRARSRRLMVVVQVALSVVLLVASGLLVTSVGRRDALGPGFETTRLGLLTINTNRQRIEPGARRPLADLALETIRRDPAVTHAALAMRAPLSSGRDSMTFRIPGYVAPSGEGAVSIDFTLVGADYFSTLGVPMVAGRTWDPLAAVRAPSAVVNETMARRFWPSADPVGQSIDLPGRGQLTVTGVVQDFSYYSIGETPRPYIFLSAETEPPSEWVLHVRTSGDEEPVLARLARALPAADARLSPYEVIPFETLRRAPLFPARLLAAGASLFGVFALLLTAVGLYGVVSASVSQRTREIGLRLALGAQPGLVLGEVLREAGVLAAAGAGFGLVGGYLAATGLRGWIVGVSPFDPGVYLSVAAALSALTLVAAWVPARRAAAVDPVAALKN